MTEESPFQGIDGLTQVRYSDAVKTEELLRYEAELAAVEEVLGAFVFVFEFPRTEATDQDARYAKEHGAALLAPRGKGSFPGRGY